STRDLVLAISRDHVSASVGNLCRRLASLGFSLGHHQAALSEFNFTVRDLGADLRCGVRITRVVELLTGQQESLCSQLRVPAVSRLNKIHNVGLALTALRQRGVRLTDSYGRQIESQDVVGGHREKTLALLWQLVLQLQVRVLLDKDRLKKEIERLQLHPSASSSAAASSSSAASSSAAAAADREEVEEVSLLLQWCRAVCARYGVKVDNLSVSLSDGRALCWLMHHYHPELVPASSIHSLTTLTTLTTLPTAWDDELQQLHHQQLQRSALLNVRLAARAASQLGGIPSLLHPEDVANTIPDKK
ncbi:abnormal spindle-like microcephaly-associated protein homolog, partial [Lampetra fluviatilis]